MRAAAGRGARGQSARSRPRPAASWGAGSPFPPWGARPVAPSLSLSVSSRNWRSCDGAWLRGLSKTGRVGSTRRAGLPATPGAAGARAGLSLGLRRPPPWARQPQRVCACARARGACARACVRARGGARARGLEQLRHRAPGGDQALPRGFLGPRGAGGQAFLCSPCSQLDSPPFPRETAMPSGGQEGQGSPCVVEEVQARGEGPAPSPGQAARLHAEDTPGKWG